MKTRIDYYVETYHPDCDQWKRSIFRHDNVHQARLHMKPMSNPPERRIVKVITTVEVIK